MVMSFRTKVKLCFYAAVVGAFFWVGSVQAVLLDNVLFSQPYLDGTFGYLSDNRLQVFVVDDFTLAGDSWVTDFHWWGGYSQTPPGSSAPGEAWGLAFFASLTDALNLTNIIYPDLISRTSTFTGSVTTGGNAINFYTFDLEPLYLTAGTYYALVFGTGTNINQLAGWMVTTDVGGPGASGDGAWLTNGVSSFRIQQDMAFEVTGIPEPATVLLMGLGLVGLGFMRRRRLTV